MMVTSRGVVRLADAVNLPIDPMAGLSDAERKPIRKYLRVSRSAGPDGFRVSRRDRYAGFVRTHALGIWIPPPFSPASFIYLLLRSLELDKLADDAYALAASSTDRRIPDFMQILSLLLVREAESLGAGHISQSYVSREERLHVVRGRALWHRSAARTKDGSVLCRFQEKTTDNIQNRLILSGLEAATRWLAGSRAMSRLRTQQFVWRSLATPYHPHRHDYDSAVRSLDRLTSAYQPGLLLSKALTFGFDPRHSTADTLLGAPIFDLAPLFERLTELVMKTALKGTEFTVENQRSDKRAILTATGQRYRSTRPDFMISKNGVPLTIVDAKFKPRYTQGGPAPRGRNRISREDIYQMFFYSQRTAAAHSLPHPLPVAVTAPVIGTDTLPSEEFRKLRWHSDTGHDEVVLTLLPLDVDETTEAIIRDDRLRCLALIQAAHPELAEAQTIHQEH